MKKKRMQRDEFITLLFGLTDESVDFRNRWRTLIGTAVWLVLSGFTMAISLIGVQGRTNIAIIIGMSFIKYLPLLIVVYALAKRLSAQYLKDVYELEDEELASNFLEDMAFGYGHERITINEGKINATDEKSPVILIGGPGYIQVNLDSVALLEKVNGDPEVIYPRSEPWRLGRFERIREIGRSDEVGKREYAIINLRDQFVSGLAVRSRTKDGIPIEAQDIKMMFSILRRKESEQETVQGDAYLFDERAVQALVYNQTIITPEPSTPSGITFPWDTTIIPLVLSELEELIKSHTLNEILASISQKEIHNAMSHAEKNNQMRVELTGQLDSTQVKNAPKVPNFESRSKITAQFYEDKFREKAAGFGVSVEWIDVGTWQLPSGLILEKHKEAWNLTRENAKKRNAVERLKKSHETAEIVRLINSVIIANYEKNSYRSNTYYKGKEASMKDMEKEYLQEWEAFVAMNPDLKDDLKEEYKNDFKSQFLQQRDASKKDVRSVAQEILRSFRKELINAKALIEKDSRPLEVKQPELAKIEKALYDISYLTNHWVKSR